MNKIELGDKYSRCKLNKELVLLTTVIYQICINSSANIKPNLKKILDKYILIVVEDTFGNCHIINAWVVR